MAIELPKFRGYTVDYRSREFRKMRPGKYCEFVPFNTPKGRKLLNDYEDKDQFWATQ